MPELVQGPSDFVDAVDELEIGDEVIINERREPMTVKNIDIPRFEPVHIKFITLQGPRGGKYAIRLQRHKDRPDDVGLMRYHTTKGRWVNASEGLVEIDKV